MSVKKRIKSERRRTASQVKLSIPAFRALGVVWMTPFYHLKAGTGVSVGNK